MTAKGPSSTFVTLSRHDGFYCTLHEGWGEITLFERNGTPILRLSLAAAEDLADCLARKAEQDRAYATAEKGSSSTGETS